MDETDSGTLIAARPRWLTWLLVILLILGFAATATLFSRVLRPLAGDRPHVVDAPIAPVTAAPRLAAPIVDQPPLIPVRPVLPIPFSGPRIAIVLTGLGQNSAQTRAAVTDLPREVALAFSPYPDATRALAALARSAGHEVWAGVPMQPKSWPRVSPGANTLLVSATAAQNRQHLAWALGRVGPVTGVTSIMGSAFTESASSLDPMLAVLHDRGLAYLDSRASGKSVALLRARAAAVPALLNDRYLDEGVGIDRNLAELEIAARTNGSAVGFASPSPASVSAIAVWAKTLEAKGFKLVPPGALAK